MEINVILLDRLSAFIKRFIFSALDDDPVKTGVIKFDIF